MAQRVEVHLVDDLDGGEATETVQFGLDGRQFEIDLNADNAKQLRMFFEGYVAAGRRVRQSRKGRTVRSGPDAAAVRAWAQAHGVDVAPRGRVPNAVVALWQQGH